MTDPSGNSEFCFPSTSKFPSASPRGTLSFSGKENSLFPLWPVIKCLLFNFNKNIYSTSTKNNFIQQQSSRTFKISSFNKIPRPSPVKYKTALSHASNISKTLSNTQLRDEQITLLSRDHYQHLGKVPYVISLRKITKKPLVNHVFEMATFILLS